MEYNPINVKIIEFYLKENNLSISKFCRLCKISTDTYKRIMTNKNFKLNAIYKIAKVLKVHIYQMFIES